IFELAPLRVSNNWKFDFREAYIMRFSTVALLLLAICGVTHADDYKVDPAHTSVVFKINHLGFSSLYGHMTVAEGKFTLDEAKPEKSSVELTLNADTVNTFVQKRDDHLKSPDFFNSKQFPTINFKSTAVKKTGKKYVIAGDLT